MKYKKRGRWENDTTMNRTKIDDMKEGVRITNLADLINEKTLPKKNVPYEKRKEIIDELFKPGGEVEEYLIEFFEGLCQCRVSDEEFFSKKEVYNWEKVLKPIDYAVDYIALCNKELKPIDGLTCYNNETLQYKYYDPRMHAVRDKDGSLMRDKEGNVVKKPREFNIFNYSTLIDKGKIDSEMTNDEIVEGWAFQNGYIKKDKTIKELSELFEDEMDRLIAKLIMYKFTKTEIKRMLRLKQCRLKKKLENMGEILRPKKEKKVINSKVCRKCGIEKKRNEFSPNKRLKDGLRTYCKECERISKKRCVS